MGRISVIIAAAVAALAPAAMQGASFRTLAAIAGTDDGATANYEMARLGGYLYGTTHWGGTYLAGTIFRLDLATGEAATVYSFPGTAGNSSPGALLNVGGILYGVTGGTATSPGNIFSFSPASGKVAQIYSFRSNETPATGLIEHDGSLYGMLATGGTSGNGTVFKFDLAAGSYNTIFNFAGGADGAYPSGKLIAVGQYLYGVTTYGGGESAGTVFRIDPSHRSERRLYSFSGADGQWPWSGLVAAGNVLYGTTIAGGSAGYGVAFSVDRMTGAESTLHNFAGGADGGSPWGGMTESNGLLYGTTTGAYSQSGPNFYGIIFRINPATGAEQTLYDFTTSSPSIGNASFAKMVNVDGLLYGSTGDGTPACGGGIFRFDPVALSLAGLHRFAGGRMANYMNGALTPFGGSLFGAAAQGGTANLGSIFRIELASGTMSTDYSFTGESDGARPGGSMIKGNGVLEGTTRSNCSAAASGTIFSFNPKAGALTTLHQFASSYDGSDPRGELIDLAGTLYGTTYYGGYDDLGTIFSYTLASHAGAVRHEFGYPTGDGTQPCAGLARARGLLYGTTERGGSAGFGTVFTFNPATSLESAVYRFTGGADGAAPQGGLAALGGRLYGTTTTGGTNGNGTVFSFDPTAGKLTTLHMFNGTDGSRARGTLLALHGQLFGTTYGGGIYGFGTVFGFDPASGKLSTLYSFSNGSDGQSPDAALVNIGDALYGTTDFGGSNNRGTVFSVIP